MKIKVRCSKFDCRHSSRYTIWHSTGTSCEKCDFKGGDYTGDLFVFLLKVTGEFSGNNIGGARYRLLKGRHPNKIRPEKSSYV